MSGKLTLLPAGVTVAVRPGTSVLESARKAGVPIRTRCGGRMGCLMCKVTQLSAGGLSAADERERRKLADMAGRGVRLACQAKVTGEAVVEVPEDPLRAAVRKLLAEQRETDLWE